MSEGVQERRILAVLMTDVYGYGAHISRGEERSESRIASDLQEFAVLCAKHQGSVVCDRGDGLKMVFESPVQAMKAALAMQQVVLSRNGSPDPDRIIVRHRMGLHVGDVLFSDCRPTGYAVAIAARLEQHATPGEVCFSDEVYRVVRPAIDLRCRYVGREDLKNIRDPVKVWMTISHDSAEFSLRPRPPVTATPAHRHQPQGGGFFRTLLGAVMLLAAVGSAAFAGYRYREFWIQPQEEAQAASTPIVQIEVEPPREPATVIQSHARPPARAQVPKTQDPVRPVLSPDPLDLPEMGPLPDSYPVENVPVATDPVKEDEHRGDETRPSRVDTGTFDTVGGSPSASDPPSF
jgi:class 3 adenylate cyclase